MLRAASLVYAIFISLIIGVLCYAILLMFSLNLNLDNHFDLRNRLLSNNRSGVDYLMSNYDQGIERYQVNLFPEDDAIITYFNTSAWGVFKLSSIISVIKKDSVRQDVLMADRHIQNAPAIYLRDNDEQFKIAGETKIIGDIYVSSRGIKKTTILGNGDLSNPIQEGKIYMSEKVLPNVIPPALIYPENFQFTLLEDLPSSSIINTFDKETMVVEAFSSIENSRLKGNIILRSKDTLTISASTILEDIIIDAPKVIFEEGFKGNVQVFASNEIILESNVSLKYPSALIVSSDTDSKKSIQVAEDSEVNGVVFLFGNGLATEDKNSILLDPKSTINGDVFCDGVLSLYGTVRGSVYSSAFTHKTPTTNYDNLIFNGKVLPNELPIEYFQISLLKKFESSESILVKKL